MALTTSTGCQLPNLCQQCGLSFLSQTSSSHHLLHLSVLDALQAPRVQYTPKRTCDMAVPGTIRIDLINVDLGHGVSYLTRTALSTLGGTLPIGQPPPPFPVPPGKRRPLLWLIPPLSLTQMPGYPRGHGFLSSFLKWRLSFLLQSLTWK